MPRRFPESSNPPARESMAPHEQGDQLDRFRLSGLTIAGIALVSAIYFADIFLKASHKCFWFDELFTVYLCRLPSFGDTWAAVTHGADFNPPLFYLLTRGVQRLFGDGLIATRLPATIGVWLFCVCLFFFVAKRAGVVSGFIAGAFPFFTLVQYYAYEARAHGIVLGWCGLALVCWQRSAEERAKRLWVAGFALSLIGALLTHVYAVYLFVPFAANELYHLFRRKGRVNWNIAAVLVFAPTVVVLFVYLPLMRGYRTVMPATYFPVSHDMIQRFLINAIGPAIPILILWLLLSGVDGVRRKHYPNTANAIPKREVLVAFAFVCVPILGLIGCKISHGPFLDRYFLSSVAGLAILLGFSKMARQAGLWIPKAMAGCMLLLMLSDLGTTIYLSIKHRIILVEPSTGFRLSTDPSDPMALYRTVSMNKTDLDILVFPSLDYLYLFKYAPPSIVPRLYYGAPIDDVNRGGYEKLAKWAHTDLRILTVSQFLAAHERFLVYENGNSVHIDEVQSILSAGYKLMSARADVGGIMYEYSK